MTSPPIATVTYGNDRRRTRRSCDRRRPTALGVSRGVSRSASLAPPEHVVVCDEPKTCGILVSEAAMNSTFFPRRKSPWPSSSLIVRFPELSFYKKTISRRKKLFRMFTKKTLFLFSFTFEIQCKWIFCTLTKLNKYTTLWKNEKFTIQKIKDINAVINITTGKRPVNLKLKLKSTVRNKSRNTIHKIIKVISPFGLKL